MVVAAEAVQIAPRDQQEIERSKLYRSVRHEGTAALLGPDGAKIDLPSSVHNVLVQIVEKMMDGKVVSFPPTRLNLPIWGRRCPSLK